MRFTCEKDIILKEISVAQEIISARNALSVMSNILLKTSDNTLHIQATDMKTYFETSIPVEVHEHGDTTTICEKLMVIIRSLPHGEIEFVGSEDNQFVIKPRFKKIDFRLKTIDAKEYPDFPTAAPELFFQIPQNELIEMINQTIFSISDDEARYFMNGVSFEKKDNDIIMVSTDGKRLAHIKKTFEESIPDFEQIIVPPKMLGLVRKRASGEGMVSIAINENHIFMEFDNQKISSSLIEGPFPQYQRVIPENQKYHILVNCSDFSDALTRVALMVEKSKRIYMDISSNSIVLRSDESDIGAAKEEITCTYEGPDTTIAINYVYLLDPLKVINGDNVCIQFTESTKALNIFPDPQKDYFHIIMPMHLDE